MSTRQVQRGMLALVLAALLLGGAYGPVRAEAPGREPEGFGLIVTIDRPDYGPGDEIVVTLEAVNGTADPVTFYFPTSQRYDLAIMDEQGRELWRWSKTRVFAMVLGEETLGPGRPRLAYRERIRISLPAGRYWLEGALTDRDRSLAGSVRLVVR